MLAVAATAPAALAQPQTEPRLAGAPERICSEEEIRQALEGSYAGPPCRFTEMPAGLDAAPQRPVPQAVAVQAPVAQPVPVQSAVRSQPVLDEAALGRPVSYSASVPPVRQQAPAIQHAVVSARHQGNAFIASQQASTFQTHSVARTQSVGRQWPPQQPGPAAGSPSHRSDSRRGEAEPYSGETVRLSDDFFSGSLVGGVERPFLPVYSYRGMILIAADGQVRTRHAGLDHRVLQVRALDNRPAPAPHAVPRRSYPYP